MGNAQSGAGAAEAEPAPAADPKPTEATPLLAQAQAQADEPLGSARSDAVSESSYVSLRPGGSSRAAHFASAAEYYFEIAVELVQMASPVVVAQLVQYVIGVSSLMFVGHLGEAKLAAAGLATTVGNVTGLSVLIGLGSGLDSLCGQAYGAGDLKLVGEHAARGLVVLTIPALLISVLWLNSEFLLKQLGQDPEISELSAKYLTCLIPSVWAMLLSVVARRFLVAQGHTRPLGIASIIVLLISVPLNIAFIGPAALGYETVHFGYLGAAMASSTTNFINACILMFFSWQHQKVERCFYGFGTYVFTGWWKFLALSLPSFLYIAFEWWSLEACTLLAGLLPEEGARTHAVHVATFSILLNTMGMVFTFAIGYGNGAAGKVSNALGANDPERAKATTWISMFVYGGTWLFFFLAFLIVPVRRAWVGLFVSGSGAGNDATRDLICAVLPIALAQQLADGSKEMLASAVRGCGKQIWVMYITFVSYWGCALPLAVAFGFGYIGQPYLHGIRGLLVGFALGTYLCWIVNIIFAATLNFEKLAAAVRKDVEEQYNKRLASRKRHDFAGVNADTNVITDSVRNVGDQFITPALSARLSDELKGSLDSHTLSGAVWGGLEAVGQGTGLGSTPGSQTAGEYILSNPELIKKDAFQGHVQHDPEVFFQPFKEGEGEDDIFGSAGKKPKK